MKRRRIGAVVAVAIVAAGLCTVGPARANEDCAQMFDRFAAEMNSIAKAYDKLKIPSEICKFMRAKDIPTHKQIVALIEANYAKCKTSAEALQFARSRLQQSLSREEHQCH